MYMTRQASILIHLLTRYQPCKHLMHHNCVSAEPPLYHRLAKQYLAQVEAAMEEDDDEAG
jgi:hypothetical protein